jgi:hypothetical protein
METAFKKLFFLVDTDARARDKLERLSLTEKALGKWLYLKSKAVFTQAVASAKMHVLTISCACIGSLGSMTLINWPNVTKFTNVCNKLECLSLAGLYSLVYCLSARPGAYPSVEHLLECLGNCHLPYEQTFCHC